MFLVPGLMAPVHVGRGIDGVTGRWDDRCVCNYLPGRTRAHEAPLNAMTDTIALTDDIRRALSRGHTVDITTTGRRTGLPRRIEIVDHVIDGRIYISGTPRPRTRAWIHNLSADPHLTVHLKTPVAADVPATARIVTDETERRAVFDWITTHAWRTMDVEDMVTMSPLIEVSPSEAVDR